MLFVPRSNSHSARELPSTPPLEGGPPTPSPRLDALKSERRRWTIYHFPCLEPVAPRGEVVVVSDRKHIPAAKVRHPDLPIWHETELAMFGQMLDAGDVDLDTLARITRLKQKCSGWFLGKAGDGLQTTR